MIEFLIAKGADPTATNNLQSTLLHWASNRETAEILIQAGADVNAKDCKGRTLLYDAARNAANAPSKTWKMYKDLAELLIVNGADVNVKDKSGDTPLHLIADSFDETKSCEISELLITNGARVNDGNQNGQTLLDIALSKERAKTAEHLRQHGGKTANEPKADGK